MFPIVPLTGFTGWITRPIRVQFVVLLLLPGVAAGQVHAQSVEIFAPGVVSVEGKSLYKGSFTPDGDSFYFFRKVTPGTEDYRIFVTRREDGQWSAPEQVVIGEDGRSDLYPEVSPDGRYLVFSSFRPAGGEYELRPNANLWISERTDGGWSDPQLLEELSTPGNYHPGPVFDPYGRLRFKSTTPDWRTTHNRIAEFDEGDFSDYQRDTTLDPWKDWRSGEVYVWDGTVSPDGRTMILGVSEIGDDGRRGDTDLYVSALAADGWSEPRRLGDAINTDAYENFVVFSPDGRWMYFVRDFSTYYRVRTDEL